MLAVVFASEADDWERTEQQPYEPDGHYSIALLIENPAIALRSGETAQDPFTAPWATKFADSTASTVFVDVLHNMELVARFEVAVVDGGRCYLPLPDGDTMVVERDQMRLAALLTGFEPWRDRFFEYFRRAGLRIG